MGDQPLANVTADEVQVSALPQVAPADTGLFGPASMTWRVHGDPAMVVAGFRALLLQAVHPLVMAGFDANSHFRDDPWGRLQRTGQWITTVTYGTTEEANDAGRKLRRLHSRLASGVEPESGRPYRVDDPDLLMWVHCTEVESFLSTYRRCGGSVTDAEADQYVDEMRASAGLVGLDPADVPRTTAAIEDYYERVRPSLRVSTVARRNMLWSLTPPMPTWVAFGTPARPAWVSLMGVATAMLPAWARRLYGLPGLPLTDLSVTIAGKVGRRALLRLPHRWVENPAYRTAMQRTAG